MTDLNGEHLSVMLQTTCPRCVKAGRDKSGPTYLRAVNVVDGVKSHQTVLCGTPGCKFAEIRSLLDDSAAKPLRERTDRAERATRAWRNATLAAVFAWPLIIFVMMLIG